MLTQTSSMTSFWMLMSQLSLNPHQLKKQRLNEDIYRRGRLPCPRSHARASCQHSPGRRICSRLVFCSMSPTLSPAVATLSGAAQSSRARFSGRHLCSLQCTTHGIHHQVSLWAAVGSTRKACRHLSQASQCHKLRLLQQHSTPVRDTCRPLHVAFT